MRELMYVPPVRTQELGAIGLLVPELGNPIFPALAQAIESRAMGTGRASILCNTESSVEEEIAYARMLLGRQVEDMVLISASVNDLRQPHDHYRELLDRGARLVFVNGHAPAIDAASVSVDERAAGELGTRHLLELGHTRIGFVAGPEHSRPTRGKAAGRENALAAAGIDGEGLVAHADWGVEGGAKAMHALLALGPRRRPTGVICSSDLMAIGALRAARGAGLRVPEELSIVGFDGTDVTEWTDPPLTTLAQPIDRIAAAAVDALATLSERPSEPLPHVSFKPALIRRGSTAPPG